MLWTLIDETLRLPPRTNAHKVTAPPKTLSADQAPVRRGSPAVKAEASAQGRGGLSRPGSSYPPMKTSTLDVDANPVYEPHGKPITAIDMDSGALSIIVVT